MTVRVPVRFSLDGYPGRRVELCGDFPDFHVAHPLVEAAPGRHELELALEPGVYRYKLFVEGVGWLLDPAARLTERVEGVENGVLVVGGLAGPLVFAPDRRHVGLLEDGRALVRAEALPGARLPEAALLLGDAAPVRVPLREALRRGDRVLLAGEGRYDVEAPPRILRFEGSPEIELPLPAPRPAVSAPPAWLSGASLYAIFVDRWHRSPGSRPDPRASARSLPSRPSVYFGGDLDGVTESLGYLEDLGVDAILLSPIQRSETPHRYDGIDPCEVDPRLGGEPALLRLLEEAHRRSLRVLVDVSLTHVNHKHASFRDVLQRQQRSSYVSWFRIKRFPVRRRDPSTYEHYYQCHDLPWLNLDDDGAREHALEAALKLVRLGVDGLRLDAMLDAPPDFWRELRARARALKPEVALLGEVVGDHLAAFAEERACDVVTDFRDRDALVAFFAEGSIDAGELAARLAFAAHRAGAFDPAFRLSFLDTHDTARFLSLANDPRRLRAALLLLAFLPSTLHLTYGTERELAAFAGPAPFDGAWPERLAMPPLDEPLGETGCVLRAALRARRALRGDGAGPLEVLRADGPHLVVRRHGRTRAFQLAVTREGQLGPEEGEVLAHVPDGATLSAQPLGARSGDLPD